MRPVPTHSTDLLYTAFHKDELMEIGRALGVSDLKMITTATLKPRRVLYHACLNGVQTYIKLKPVAEMERSIEIADVTDGIYASLLSDFNNQVLQSQPQLDQKRQEADYFCAQLHAIESAKPWNKARYENTWNVNDYPHRWQKKAIETYQTIRHRIDSGDYALPASQTAGSLTAYWSLRNLEYKHYRCIARGLVELHIRQRFPLDSLLTMRSSTQRTMTLFVGGMGSGKSTMTEQYLALLPADRRHNAVLHNADYLKYALYRSALRDGVLPQGYRYSGPEVQAESSNALYEGTRKRSYLARQTFQAPDVVLNSIVLGSFEVQEGIASGGKVIAHHIYTSSEDAIIDADKRRAIIQRVPPAEDIRWSEAASAKSLLLLTQPEYKGTNVTVHLYHREAGKPPEYYGTIDALRSTLYVFDKNVLKALSRSALGAAKKDAAACFIKRFTVAGYSIVETADKPFDAEPSLSAASPRFAKNTTPPSGPTL